MSKKYFLYAPVLLLDNTIFFSARNYFNKCKRTLRSIVDDWVIDKWLFLRIFMLLGESYTQIFSPWSFSYNNISQNSRSVLFFTVCTFIFRDTFKSLWGNHSPLTTKLLVEKLVIKTNLLSDEKHRDSNKLSTVVLISLHIPGRTCVDMFTWGSIQFI